MQETPESTTTSTVVSSTAGRAGKHMSLVTEATQTPDEDAISIRESHSTQTDISPRTKMFHMRSHDALQLGLILSQQEKLFGTNMYQSLTEEDEPEIERLHHLGFTTEEAVMKIFQNRYVLGIEARHTSPHHGDHIHSTDDHSRSDSRTLSTHADQTSNVQPRPFPPPFRRPHPTNRMHSSDALRLGLQLSDQEATYGINMYDSLDNSDEEEMLRLLQEGYTIDQAVLKIFETKVAKGKPAARAEGSSPSEDRNRTNASPTTVQPAAPSAPSPVHTATVAPARSGVPSNWRQDLSLSPRSLHWVNALTSLTDNEAMHMAYLLTQQERDFGINMYDAMRTEDQPEIMWLVDHGWTSEQAMLYLFERRFAPHRAAQRRHGPVTPRPYVHRHTQHGVPAPAPAAHPPTATGIPHPPPIVIAPGPPTAMAHAVARRSPQGTPYNTPSHTPSHATHVGRSTTAGSTSTTTTPHPRTPASTPTHAATATSPTQPEGEKKHTLTPKNSFMAFLSNLTNSVTNTFVEEDDEPTASLRYRDSDVMVLRDMGYTEEQAVTALLQCDNNVPLAIDLLCKSELHPN